MITIPGIKGDIEGVTAGDGLSGGGTDGTPSLALDLHELTAAVVADGDFIPIIDTNDSNGSRKEAVADLATLFAGDGLTASNSAIAVNVDDSTIETDSDAIRIKDDGVTAAKLFNLARGSVLIGNGSAATAELTIGNNTYVLTSDGTDIAWAAAASGVSLSGSTDNTIATVTGSNALAGEANLTFNSNILTVGADADIEPQIILQNDNNSLQIGVANATDDMISGSADGDAVINSVGDHKMLIAQNDTLAITLDADGDVTFANNIDGGTWLGTTIAVNKGGTGATALTNLITMGSHTTGDFVGTITGGTGITSTGGTTGEDVDHTLSVDAAQTGITSLGTQVANFAVGNGFGVVIGTATQETVSIGDGATDLVPELQVLGTAAADSSILLASFSTTATTAGSPIIALAKGGNATLGSHTVVTDGEELGNIIAFGDDGTDLETPAASIQFEVDGTPGSGDMPGRIIFGTTKDGETAVTEAVRIDSSQNVTVAKSITYDSTPANPSYSGVTATFTAGETLEAGEVVYLKAADTRMWKAVSVVSGTGLITPDIMCVAMAAEDISAGDAGLFLLQGFLRDDTNFPTYAIGETLYVPEAEQSSLNVPHGTIPTTDGDFVQVIGWAADGNTVYFNPDFTIIEHA